MIMESYSQSSQDAFVLYFTNYKRDGTFLEIGSNHPIDCNNSYILEKKYNWRGVMVEYDPSFEEMYKSERKSKYMIADATTIDYKSLLSGMDKHIDYLQIDLEVENNSTLECLYNLQKNIFTDYKFAVITFEHDNYRDIDKNTRSISREIFKQSGYVLIYPDIHVFNEGKYCNFEDWYVHPDLVDKNMIDRFLKFTHNKVNKHPDLVVDFFNDYTYKNLSLRKFLKSNEIDSRLYYTFDLLLDFSIKNKLIEYIYSYLCFGKNLQEIKDIITDTLNGKYLKFKYIIYNDTYTVGVYDYPYNDKFDVKIENDKLTVSRIDKSEGWGLDLKIQLIYNDNVKHIDVGKSDCNIKVIMMV